VEFQVRLKGILLRPRSRSRPLDRFFLICRANLNISTYVALLYVALNVTLNLFSILVSIKYICIRHLVQTFPVQ
jgi:hypothetical protein